MTSPLTIVKLDKSYTYYSNTTVTDENDIEALTKILKMSNDVKYQIIIQFTPYGIGGIAKSPVITTNSPTQKAIAWFNVRDNILVRYLASLENGNWIIKPNRNL